MLERTVKYVLTMAAALMALGSIPASSDEFEFGVSLASLDSSVTVGSSQNDRPGGDRNATLKEQEFESPEMIAVIESNREDRERMVVIDR
jgi:hypothetical protein